jgi:hypothetical protein
MNGAASGLIEAIKTAIGPHDKWDLIPTGTSGWWKYGSGGISAWGTLCGVPNGCIAVLGLMNKQGVLMPDGKTNIMDQLMLYYSQSNFPVEAYEQSLYDLSQDAVYGWTSDYAPIPLPDEDVLAHTVSGSPLCHISVSKWADAAGVNLDKTAYGGHMKEDRCGKITADMAALTAEFLNNLALPEYLTYPAETTACMSCHNQLSDVSKYPAQQGKMECGECHDMPPSHGRTKGPK